MDTREIKKTVYTAFSKHYFFLRKDISAYVLDVNHIPLNPFMNWSYYMDKMVDRFKVVRANNNLIHVSNELWTFGPIADGVLEEIRLAARWEKELRFFSFMNNLEGMQEISVDRLVFETEVLNNFKKEQLIAEISDYVKMQK